MSDRTPLQSGIGSDCIKISAVITIDGTSTKQGGNAAGIREVGCSSGQSISNGFKVDFPKAFGFVELVSNALGGKYILCSLLLTSTSWLRKDSYHVSDDLSILLSMDKALTI